MSRRGSTSDDRRTATWLQSKGWRQTLGGSTWSKAGSPLLSVQAAVAHQTHVDRAAATSARDEAITAVAQASDPGWLDAAVEAVRDTARQLPEMTTDDVEDLHPNLLMPSEPRVWGAAMLRARDEGLIENTGYMAPSNRRSSRARRKALWRSLVYAGAAVQELAEVGHG
jgi:hypothetical protein